MKLKRYFLSTSYEHTISSVIDELADFTPLQMRHHLKENWDNFILLCENSNNIKNIDTILKNRQLRDIKIIRKLKPVDITMDEDVINRIDIKNLYNDISVIISEHSKLTINALLWASLCSAGEKMRLERYLESYTHTDLAKILVIFILACQDEALKIGRASCRERV